MQATNGSAGSHRRGRVIGCTMALVFALSALIFMPTAANATTTTQVLALGDSITFGYTAEKFGINKPNEAPVYFETGPSDNFVKSWLSRVAEIGPGIVTVNSACPGETTNGFIGENLALGGEVSTEPATLTGIQGPGDAHPCAYANVGGLPLHNSLSVGGQTISQLEDAISVLTSNAGSPAHPVDAITLNIGANDQLAAIKECETEVATEFGTFFVAKQPHAPAPGEKLYGPLNGNPAHDVPIEKEAALSCIVGKALYVTGPHIVAQVQDIIGVLNSPAAGNAIAHGIPIVFLAFYNPESFILPGSDGLQGYTNSIVKSGIEAMGPASGNVHWANPYLTINKGNAIVEQNNICRYTEECNPNVQVVGGEPVGKDGDIHPSAAGDALLGKLLNEAYLAPAI